MPFSRNEKHPASTATRQGNPTPSKPKSGPERHDAIAQPNQRSAPKVGRQDLLTNSIAIPFPLKRRTNVFQASHVEGWLPRQKGVQVVRAQSLEGVAGLMLYLEKSATAVGGFHPMRVSRKDLELVFQAK